MDARRLLAHDPKKALELAVRLEKKAANDTARADARNVEGSALRRLGRLKEAAAAYRASLALRQKIFGALSLEAASVMLNLGRALYENGDTAARASISGAVAIFSRSALTDEQKGQLFTGYLFLSKTDQKNGDFLTGKAEARQALDAAESDTTLRVAALGELAPCIRYGGDPQGAVEVYKNALDLCEKNRRAENRDNIPAIRLDLAGCYYDLQEYGAALLFCSAAQSGFEKTPAQSENIARALLKTGDCYWALEKRAYAETYYRKAARLLQNGRFKALQAVCLLDMAKLAGAGRRHAEALGCCEQALRLLDYDGGEKTPYPLEVMTALSERAFIAFDLADASGKAGGLQKALGDYREAIRFVDRHVGRFEDAKSALILRGYFDRLFGGACELCARLGDTEQAFGYAEQGKAFLFKKTSGEAGRKSIAAVRAGLKTGQTLLEYCFGRQYLTAFKITDADCAVFFLQQEGVEKTVETFFRKISVRPEYVSEKDRDFTAEALWLEARLVAPLHLQPQTTLMIVPDGVLHYLPFEALLTEKPRNLTLYRNYPYLAKQYCVSYKNTAFFSPKPGLLRGDGLFAFAPTFDKRPNGLSPLQNNIPEIKSIEKIFGGTVFAGKSATVEAFSADAPAAGIIHVATHGAVNNIYPEYSYLAFSPAGDSAQFDALYAPQIAALRLNAGLAVLSACQTGAGPLYRGDGPASLSGAFLTAGARCLLASLWSVDDRKTTLLTTSFYKNLKSGLAKDEALRQAKQTRIETVGAFDGHPFYWAAFTLTGDVRPLAERPAGRWKYAAAGLALLAAALFLWKTAQKRRKPVFFLFKAQNPR